MDYEYNITNLLFGILIIFFLIFVVLAIINNVTDMAIILDKTKYQNRLNHGNMPLYQNISLFASNKSGTSNPASEPSSNPASEPSSNPASTSALQPLYSSGPLKSGDEKLYQVGNLFNNTTDYITNLLKTGLDIANNGAHLMGNLLNKSVNGVLTVENIENIDAAINLSTNTSTLPSLDQTTSPIQTQGTSNQTKWCYIGDFNKKRGCAEIANSDFCPGDTFDNYEKCNSSGFTKDPSDPKSFLSSESTKISKKYYN